MTDPFASVTLKEFETLKSQVQKLEARVNGMAKDLKAPSQSGNVASDEDLDGQYGDPEIKYDPKEKYWNGATYVGCHFSQCPADYLKAMAKYLDACEYMAKQNGEEQKAKWKRLDAGRARGWALRIESGYKPKGDPIESDGGEEGEGSIPF